MKTCLLVNIKAALLLLCIAASTAASAATEAPSGSLLRTPRVQEDILRTAPDDTAPFVRIVKPAGGTPPTVEVLSRQGDWEEVRLHYRFKYNGSMDPNVCAMSLFEGTFTGFRKAP